MGPPLSQAQTSQRAAREAVRRLIESGVPGWAVTVGREGLPEFRARGPEVSECGAWGGGQGGRWCRRDAGWGTEHPGVGRCRTHERGRRARAEGAWAVAHIIAAELELDPMQALLLCVRRAGAWAAYYQSKLAEVDADDDAALMPGGSAYPWVEAAERVTSQLARYSTMAINAGVAALLVQQAQVEGETIARVLNAALAAADLDEAQELRARAALRSALLEVAAPAQPVRLAIEGGQGEAA